MADFLIHRAQDTAFLVFLGACGVLLTKAIIFISGG